MDEDNLLKARRSLQQAITALENVSERLEQDTGLLAAAPDQRLMSMLAAVEAAKAARGDCDLLIVHLLELAGAAGAGPGELGWEPC